MIPFYRIKKKTKLRPTLEKGFPGDTSGKEPTCNSGDPGSIPGLGKSPGEGNGYPLQYSRLENSMDRGAWQAMVASLVAQLVRNLPAMQETQVQSLCWEDPLEKGMATHSNILAWEIP